MLSEITKRGVLAGAVATAAGMIVGAAAPGLAKAAGADLRVVETAAGKVRGATEGGLYVFRGIPYGGSTAGAGRFMPPAPVQPWAGVREALELGPNAPQARQAGFSNPDFATLYNVLAAMKQPTQSEDCLVLNVWTPAPDNRKRPVMVWLHGGGFATGSAAIYNGSALATKGDVVMVGVNHRLNIFGYMHLAEVGGERYADSGNAGMLDIVLALKWVRDNIHRFGGDPGNVTIFGESGGGFKVSTLMAMPAAKGLFHKAIVQSGSYIHATKPADGDAATRAVMQHLGLAANQVDQLQAAPVAQLLGAFAAVNASGGIGRRAFAPVADGRLLPRDPFAPTAPELSADIPMIIGTTEFEAVLFFGMMGGGGAFGTTDATLSEQVQKYAQLDSLTADKVIAVYKAEHPAASASDILFLIGTDQYMRGNAILQAERKLAQRRGNVYMYQFNWQTPILGGKLKSIHALELPFLFQIWDGSLGNTGDSPARFALGDQMTLAWTSFARTGDPNHPGLPQWEPYSLPQTSAMGDTPGRATMLFNTPSTVAYDPAPSTREFWAARMS